MAREAGHVATSCAARIANASTAVSNRQPVASRLAWFYADTDLRSIPGPCHPDPSAAPLPRRPPPANGESLKFGCKATGNPVYSLAWPPDPARRSRSHSPSSPSPSSGTPPANFCKAREPTSSRDVSRPERNVYPLTCVLTYARMLWVWRGGERAGEEGVAVSWHGSGPRTKH